MGSAGRAEQRLMRGLWWGFALSAWLFAMVSFRWSTERFATNLSVPQAFLGCIIVLGLFTWTRTGASVRPLRWGSWQAAVFALLIVFWAWHLVGLAGAGNLRYATREVFKLAAGIGVALITYLYFPRGEGFAARFWLVVAWPTAILLAVLTWYYMIHLDTPYLGNNLDEVTRGGRNTMNWFVMLLIPIISFAAGGSRGWLRMAYLPPLGMLVFAWVVGGSRGAWLSTAVAAAFLVVLAIVATIRSLPRVESRRVLGRSATLVSSVVLAAVAGIAIAGRFTNLWRFEAVRRFTYVFNPSAVPELSSYESRFSLITGALRCWRDDPITGIGLVNANRCNSLGLWTHNDYVGILAELGLIGFGLFAAVGFLLVFRFAASVPRSAGWASWGTRASLVAVIVSLNFINTYTTPVFWFFLGYLLALSVDEREAQAPGISPAPARAGVEGEVIA